MNVDDTHKEIRYLKDTAKNHAESIDRLTKRFEESDRKNSEKNKQIFDTLDKIKESQHTQEIGNLNLKYTMKNINDYIQKEDKSKEENRKDTKQIKYIVISSGIAFVSSLAIAIIQIIF